MGEKIDWVRKKLHVQGKAERDVGPELSDFAREEARMSRARYAQWDQTFDRLDPTGERRRAKEFIRSIDFDTLEDILSEHIDLSAGPDEKIEFPKIARLTDHEGKFDGIFIEPHAPDTTVRGISHEAASADVGSGVICLRPEIFDIEDLEGLNNEEKRMERLSHEFSLLFTIIHEEIHLIGKVWEKLQPKVHGLRRFVGRRRSTFHAFNEGLTELWTLYVMEEYVRRIGFREWTTSDAKFYLDHIAEMRSGYRREVMVVFYVQDAIARHAGEKPHSVWKSLIRSYVRGLNLDHAHVGLENVIGRENLYLLKKAEPGSAELRLLHRRLAKADASRLKREREAWQRESALKRLERGGMPDMTINDIDKIVATLPANVDWQTFATQGKFFGSHEYEKVLFFRDEISTLEGFSYLSLTPDERYELQRAIYALNYGEAITFDPLLPVQPDTSDETISTKG